MDPVLALEWQREQLEFLRTRAARDYFGAFFRDLDAKWGKELLGDDVGNRVTKFVAVTAMIMDTADTYAVDDDMMDLVTYAADTLPDDTVHQWTPPSPFGFVLLPRTEVYPATPPRRELRVCAFAWGTFGGRVNLFFFSDNDDLAQQFPYKTVGSVTGIMGHLSYCHGQAVNFGDHVRAKSFWDWPTVSSPISEEDEESTTRLLMTVLAFWHLSQQTIASTERAEVPRHAKKRWLRAGGAADHVIRVVRLRRRSGPAPDGEGREWHHRWIVRGHWRQQPCGPGRTETRPVWIAAYVKGPEDAPLLRSDKINYLVR